MTTTQRERGTDMNKIDTEDKFNALPIGAVMIDRDGWEHTKIRHATGDAVDTTTYTTEEGRSGTFAQPWAWGAVLKEPEVGDLVLVDPHHRANLPQYYKGAQVAEVVQGGKDGRRSVLRFPGLSDIPILNESLIVVQPPFRIGERVRVVDGNTVGLEVGDEVTVAGFHSRRARGDAANPADHWYVTIAELGVDVGLWAKRFERIDTEPVDEQTPTESEILGAVLQYALDRMSVTERERIQGYWDGLLDEAGL